MSSSLWPLLPIATVVVLSAFYALDFTRRRRVLEKIGDAPQLQRMMASLSSGRRLLKAILVVTAVTAIAIALCRPQREGETTWRKRGIDLVVAMDFSKSMLARDVYPDRLSRMAKEVDVLFDELESDRVAVVVFAGSAAHFPLSHDHEAARGLFHGLMSCPPRDSALGGDDDSKAKTRSWCAPQRMPPGSDLGEAVMVARCIIRPDLLDDPGCSRVGGRGRGGAPLTYDEEEDAPLVSAEDERREHRAKAIVLFTDGEDTEERARTEIEQAVKLGIHVFIVGVGTRSGELIPEYDEDGRETGSKKTEDGKSFVTTRLDRAGLMELAEIAGGEGHYFALDPKRFRAADLIERLQSLKKGDLDDRVKKEWKDVYQWFFFPAFLLLLIEACISGRRRRVLYPEERA